ncbi:MAG: AsmA-like C-terminal region-containing protein, partial [Opitutaceae bacterium]|nr:AsmA-like C-terminal region-containing protein [Opitutaceae bacterium]
VTNAAAPALAGAIAFDNPPRLVASGNYTLAPLSGALNATLASDGPARLAGVPLENLSLSASDNNGDIAIPALAARLAGGDLSAKLRIVLPRQAAAFDTANATASVEGTLRGARLARLQTLLAPLRKPPAGKQPAGETWTPDDTLDLAASVTTPLSDPARARGTASAAVVSPRLGEIHLLGGLSKLGLGSLMLTRLETDITLDEHLWNFANTRVTGPSARIEARGAADIVSERLNFRAKIYPVGETGAVLRNTLGVLLAPLSSILEVSLQGPFDAPRWFFSGGPTGILQNIGSDAPDLPPLPPDDSPKPAAKPGPR